MSLPPLLRGDYRGVALLTLLFFLTACGNKPNDRPGLFVLGVDGADPIIVDRMMAEGRLPNFARLAGEGTYQRLGTSTPPQSPVAWSNFISGENPGGHGMFDFIHRDPKTYQPVSSSALPTGGSSRSMQLFGYTIPLGGQDLKNNRGGTAFWDILAKAGVNVEVYRVPGNYPPTPSDAKTLSGMGTVDMRGDFGTYTWYTTERPDVKKKVKADLQRVTLDDDDLDGIGETVHTTLKGPPDLLHLEPGKAPTADDYLTTPLTFHLDPRADVVFVRGGDPPVLLQQGEWSDWVTVSFHALPFGLMSFDGIVRFYLKEARPIFQLYASPVNISPAKPAQPITTPAGFVKTLHDALGLFYTLGMPEETNALKDELFDDDDYARQVKLVQEDSDHVLDLALSRFERGDMTFVYLSDIDLQCHMLWRHGDPKYRGAAHPARDEAAAAHHAHDIEGYYEHVDMLLGQVRERLPAETLLIVMSDHGFQPFTRKVHLNAWLRDRGYLVLADGKRTGHIFDAGAVDWSRTTAYGVGFNAIYLNLAGREGKGIVNPEQADEVMSRIVAELTSLRDPKNGAQVVLRVDRAKDVYSGERVSQAPDLVVGYNVQYGCSDASTLGEVVEPIIEDNLSRWSGNHLMAPEVVPGVVLMNRKLTRSGYNLTDVTVSILDYYGLPPGKGMVGKSVFRN
jgi:predicted AlkP superfamily phosphohydrolase/phosphomutase